MAMDDPSWDFWACTQNGDGWHSIRETARFMMYEEQRAGLRDSAKCQRPLGPIKTSLERLAGLLPVPGST